MDYFVIEINGKNLDLHQIQFNLSDLKLATLSKSGETEYISYDKKSRSARGIPFDETTIAYEVNDLELYDLLRLLNSKKIAVSHFGIDSINLWSFIERSDQINDELSPQEISMLKSTGASFLWTAT